MKFPLLLRVSLGILFIALIISYAFGLKNISLVLLVIFCFSGVSGQLYYGNKKNK